MNNAFRMLAARSTPTPVPITHQVATDLKDTVGAAAESAGNLLDGLPHFLSRTLIALAVLVVGLVLLKLGKMVISSISRSRGKKHKNASRPETFRSIVSSIFSYVMFFILTAVILRLYGFDITSLLAAAGVVGIAIAFGAQTLVKDLLSGLFIWGEKSVSVGDLVTINDLSGTVESITIRITSIRNFNGDVYYIPNGDIRTITNMSRGFKRAIVNVPCPYEANQERLVAIVKEEMEKAAKEVDGIDKVPDVMSIVSFDQNAVRLQVAVTCPVGEHWRIEREIRTRIKNRFYLEGIIMPHYVLPKQD